MPCGAEKEHGSAECVEEESFMGNNEGTSGPIQERPGRRVVWRGSALACYQSFGKDLSGGTQKWLESGRA